MSVSRELKRRVGRYEPCLPRLAKKSPAGPGWIHEIKHDGFRILAELNAGGVKLITRKGFDLAERFPLAVAAIAALPARSCIVDGEAIACDANGLSVFDLLRYRRQDDAVTLCAFVPERLRSRLRGHRVKATGIAIPARAAGLLGQGQKPGCTGGEA